MKRSNYLESFLMCQTLASSSVRHCWVWRDLLQQQRQHTETVVHSWLKLAPHLSASNCHLEARGLWRLLSVVQDVPTRG